MSPYANQKSDHSGMEIREAGSPPLGGKDQVPIAPLWNGN